LHIVGASDCVLSDKVIRKLRYEEFEPTRIINYNQEAEFNPQIVFVLL